MHTVGRWTLDAGAISESKALAVRIDSINSLNHVNDGDPAGLANVNSLAPGTNFGQVTGKLGANRTFQASLLTRSFFSTQSNSFTPGQTSFKFFFSPRQRRISKYSSRRA
jgi:hypothetical protein